MFKPALPILNPVTLKATNHVLSKFQIDGEPAHEAATLGQLHIFSSIAFQMYPRIEIICTTQYGKSLITALACLVLSCISGIRVAVVAPSKDKAKIIMRYYIEHLGDHPLFFSQLEKNTRLERLRQEESKERITLRNGGGVYILSADARNSKKSIEAAMGAGARVVIGDEMGLIPNDVEATIFRMIAGKKGRIMYVKIGNPFYRNHFRDDWENNPRYHKIYIDYLQALKEGRYTPDTVDDAKLKPLFDILYGCEFPPEGELDENDCRQLIKSDEITIGTVDKILGKLRLGCDVGGGGDWNVYTLRGDNHAKVAGKNKSKDTMTNVNEIVRIKKENPTLEWNEVYIDDIGIGRGLYDRMRELKYPVIGVSVGGSPIDKTRYANIRAENHWAKYLWLQRQDTSLAECLDEHGVSYWDQLAWSRYKTTSDKVMQMEPKADTKKRHLKSPDFDDSLMLTFTKKPAVGAMNI